jgi:hypothetical protein
VLSTPHLLTSLRMHQQARLKLLTWMYRGRQPLIPGSARKLCIGKIDLCEQLKHDVAQNLRCIFGKHNIAGELKLVEKTIR